MDWYVGMSLAIDYIEEHLTSDIEYSIAAQFIGCSAWEFQRIFSFITKTTLSEYIRKRRLSLAAEDIQSSPDKIIDIAMRYGYDSHASFSRAFSQMFGLSPSILRSSKVAVATYSKISFKSMMESWYYKMSRFSERGYVVKENGPAYITKDMDKTLKWFEDVLGWYGDVVQRDPAGIGTYGCVYDVPQEIALSHVAPFFGIHMFPGEPKNDLIAVIGVRGLEEFYHYVKSNGWNGISEITKEPWGSFCTITTIDGYILRFSE